MKKKTTSNPLKTFNDNKAKAYMKAGGTMKTFKKSLPKAQLGNDVNYYDQNKENAKRLQMINATYPQQYTTDNSGYMQFTPSVKPEPSAFQNMRRNALTKRSNILNEKGTESLQAGNKEKAFRQFDKSDRLLEKRAKLREKAGYMKGGVVKKKKK